MSMGSTTVNPSPYLPFFVILKTMTWRFLRTPPRKGEFSGASGSNPLCRNLFVRMLQVQHPRYVWYRNNQHPIPPKRMISWRKKTRPQCENKSSDVKHTVDGNQKSGFHSPVEVGVGHICPLFTRGFYQPSKPWLAQPGFLNHQKIAPVKLMATNPPKFPRWKARILRLDPGEGGFLNRDFCSCNIWKKHIDLHT